MPLSLGPVADRTFAAVIFDLDGTLIDSTAAVERSWRRWAEEEDVPAARLAGLHGVPARGIVERVLPPERWDAAERRIHAIELADTAGIEVLPGASAALAALAGATGAGVAPVRAAIATSCTRPLAEARLSATGLARPPVVVTVDDVARGKPAPDPFLEAARQLGVDPAACLVVEDAPSGLEAARAAGCATLAVTTTTPPETLRSGGGADAVVATLADVVVVLDASGVRIGVTRP